MSSVVVAALYKFVALDDYHALREPLLDVTVDYLVSAGIGHAALELANVDAR